MFTHEVAETVLEVIEAIPTLYWQAGLILPPETQQDPSGLFENPKSVTVVVPGGFSLLLQESNKRNNVISVKTNRQVTLMVFHPYFTINHDEKITLGSPWVEFGRANKYHELLLSYLASYSWSTDGLKLIDIDNMPYLEMANENSFYAGQSDLIFEFQQC